MKPTSARRILTGTALVSLALNALAGSDQTAATATTAPAQAPQWQKPTWLTDLSVGAKETYDDNIMLVDDKTPGMGLKGSLISTFSPKVGFNFAPLLGNQQTLQTLSLVYTPDYNIFHNAPTESYDAQRVNDSIKGKVGAVSFAADNGFLFNDGSAVAPMYAFNQGSDTQDKNRSAYATASPRERRKQIQDRSTVALQYDVDKFFIRPAATLLYYNLMTDWHNSSAAPYKGYQDYASRADVNGGTDLGYKVMPGLAITVGYRYGHQYQQAFTHAVDTAEVNGQQMQSSSDYQRVLLGLEGNPLKWLNVKIVGGPDFRNYNSAAPVNDHNPVKYYGEAAITATLTPSQSLSFTYKQWQWLSSTGKYPLFDSTYALSYHWSATHQLGFDLGAKFLSDDYTSGSTSTAEGASAQRNDAVYAFSAGMSYAFTPHLNANLAYSASFGRNLQDNLPVSGYAAYREFDDQTVSVGMQYKF